MARIIDYVRVQPDERLNELIREAKDALRRERRLAESLKALKAKTEARKVAA